MPCFTTYSAQTETSRSYNQSVNIAEVRRSYNKHVVHSQARRMGWRCPQPGTPAYVKNDWSIQK